MDSTRFSRAELGFLIGVPLAWAVLLLFHPTGGDDYYSACRATLIAGWSSTSGR